MQVLRLTHLTSLVVQLDPSRLGSGEANTDTFLRGDSSFQKVTTSVGIGTTQPFDVTSSLTTFAPNGVGINTYQGKITLGLNRVESTLDEYSTLGIAQYKLSTFSVGDDGRLQVKNAARAAILTPQPSMVMVLHST